MTAFVGCVVVFLLNFILCSLIICLREKSLISCSHFPWKGLQPKFQNSSQLHNFGLKRLIYNMFYFYHFFVIYMTSFQFHNFFKSLFHFSRLIPFNWKHFHLLSKDWILELPNQNSYLLEVVGISLIRRD